MLARGEGISMNKSLAAHYLKLAADQGFANAQWYYGDCLLSGVGTETNFQVGIEYLRCAADQSFVSAQLRCGTLFRQGHHIKQDLRLSAHYFKLAADQSSIEGQLEYSRFLLRGYGVRKDIPESERYLRLAVDQGNVLAQMCLGIYLMSGLFGRFDFEKARQLFALASRSHRFAVILRDSLSNFDCELISPSDILLNGSIFSILRNPSDDSIPMIRFLNLHLSENVEGSFDVVGLWQHFAHLCFEYLVDLSQSESVVLHSFPSDLLLCESVFDMIPIIFCVVSQSV
jgi:hypothetical protein